MGRAIVPLTRRASQSYKNCRSWTILVYDVGSNHVLRENDFIKRERRKDLKTSLKKVMKTNSCKKVCLQKSTTILGRRVNQWVFLILHFDQRLVYQSCISKVVKRHSTGKQHRNENKNNTTQLTRHKYKVVEDGFGYAAIDKYSLDKHAREITPHNESRYNSITVKQRWTLLYNIWGERQARLFAVHTLTCRPFIAFQNLLLNTQNSSIEANLS